MIRPVDLPLVRHEIASRREAVFPENAEAVCAAAAKADLFYITEPMIELVMAAKDSLEDFKVEPEDLPSLTGFCYFAKPMWRYEFQGAGSIVVGAIWDHDGEDLHVAWLIDRDYYADNRFSKRDAIMKFRSGNTRLMPIEIHNWSEPVAAISDGAVIAEWGRLFLKSAWLLMQQPVASDADAEYARSDRRRLQREDLPLDRIRIIGLRRPRSNSEQGHGDREYNHQWIVRGHWRQHWYPKREVHRPLWIAPHIKGPEDAPLLGGEKVHLWNR